MDHSTPDLPVLHCLLEFAQSHVQWVSDAIQPSHPLSPLSPPVFNLSQHQGLFQLALCTKWLRFWSCSFSISSSNKYSGFISFSIDWFDLDCKGILSLGDFFWIRLFLLKYYMTRANPRGMVTSLRFFFSQHHLSLKYMCYSSTALLKELLSPSYSRSILGGWHLHSFFTLHSSDVNIIHGFILPLSS